MTSMTDESKLSAIESQVDQLVEQIATAMDEHDDQAVLQCEQQVDELLAQLDQLLGNDLPRGGTYPPATLH
jgi:hypothetical protein